MSVSSGLHCDDKLLPETPKEDLYHVGVSIPVPRGSLSNSHASHVPHFSPSAAFTWFPDVLLPPAAICKAASRVQLSHCCQDNANTATSYSSTPKHHLQPQHLPTTSHKAKLRSDSPCFNCAKPLSFWFRVRACISALCQSILQIPTFRANVCPTPPTTTHAAPGETFLNCPPDSHRCSSGGSTLLLYTHSSSQLFHRGEVIQSKRNCV